MTVCEIQRDDADRRLAAVMEGKPDPPRIAVQVKMRADQVGTQELDGLEGAIVKFGADHGLMVSWGGFSTKAREQARTRGFKVRCWDQWDLIRGITENWDRLPDDVRADLPFQRI